VAAISFHGILQSIYCESKCVKAFQQCSILKASP